MYCFLITFALWIGWFGHHPTSGKSVAASTFTMTDITKMTDIMAKRKGLSQLIDEFNATHGDKYDYSLVNEWNYKNTKSIIPVICKAHDSVFKIAVSNHLYQKQGCPICANIKRRISNTGNVRKRTKTIYGVGVNDYDGYVKFNHIHIQSYHTWVQMLKRCYSKEFLERNKTYEGCSVCDEWLQFSNFKKWFDENYVEGYSLDKDILVRGNKIYSPQTCCFVPQEINTLFCKSDAKRGLLPIGVSCTKRAGDVRFVAYINEHGKHIHLGTYRSKMEAFLVYKNAKESYIKQVATKYIGEGLIGKSVYDALMNYRVDLLD